MSESIHPAAPHHLPFFIPGADGSDTLTVVMGIFLVATVLWVGTLYWKLHSLPERMAHKSQKLQFEIVAVLGLISLFTHMHIFWVAGLLLALIDLPVEPRDGDREAQHQDKTNTHRKSVRDQIHVMPPDGETGAGF